MAEIAFGIDGFLPHHPQQTANPFGIVVPAAFRQFILPPDHTQRRISQTKTIHDLYQLQMSTPVYFFRISPV
jgi:hypothetical protein